MCAARETCGAWHTEGGPRFYRAPLHHSFQQPGARTAELSAFLRQQELALRTTTALFGALALSIAFNAHAADGEELLGKDYAACMDKAGGVTARMLECMGTETKAQDVKLNASYQKALAGLTAARKKELTEIQRMWLKYRDANCKFYMDPDGGTLARVTSSQCFMMATATRADELRRLTID
jgi:uncharacterized protein YecT (DUF1311 family)